MEPWMWTGILVVLLAFVALYSAVAVLLGSFGGVRLHRLERWGSVAALSAAGLAIVTFALYVGGS